MNNKKGLLEEREIVIQSYPGLIDILACRHPQTLLHKQVGTASSDRTRGSPFF